MDDQLFDLKDPGDRIVARLLEAYGTDRLTPAMTASTRMRMAVMTAAHRRAALIEADATFDAAGATTAALAAKRAHAARTAWRRPVVAVLAGCLTLAVLAGTAFSARPGGPLYAARLWTEMANLPAGVVDRADAEVHRLEQRIMEAQQASTAGDGSGTEAALVAYSRIVVEAAKGTDQDPAAAAAIEVTVTRHVVVLTQMVGSVPAPAKAAAEDALSSSTMALDDLAMWGKKGGDVKKSTIDRTINHSGATVHPAPVTADPADPADDAVTPDVATPEANPEPGAENDGTDRPGRLDRANRVHRANGGPVTSR